MGDPNEARATIASKEKPAAAGGPRQAAEAAITNVQARRVSPAVILVRIMARVVRFFSNISRKL